MNNEPIPPEVHAAARLALFDICECGDYRREHRGAGGRCIMADDLCHGFEPCWAFRLYETATEIPAWYRGRILA